MSGLSTIRALATDYDGTLAENDVVPPSTVAALARFKASGRQLILVTGRHLPDLKQVFGNGLPLFDIAVLENGGLLYYPQTDSTRALSPAPPAALVERLRPHNLPEFAVGQTIVATKATEAAIVRDAIAALGLDLEIILNTDSLMILPTGIHKASGLASALTELRLDPAHVAAIGDAENDIVFLKSCGHAIAVANALPQVKAVATMVMTKARGAGVEEFIGRVVGHRSAGLDWAPA